MRNILRFRPKNTGTDFANLKMAAFVFRLSHGYALGYLAYAVFMYLPSFLCNVFLFQFVVDRLETGGREREIVFALILIAVYLLIGDIYMAWFEQGFRLRKEEQILTHVRAALYEKAEALDLAAYETPDFYNRYVRAMDAADEHVLQSVVGLCELFAQMVNILLTTGIFLAAGSSVFLIAACSIGCTLWLNRIIAGKEEGKRKALIPLQRRQAYCQSIFSERRFAQEVRLYQPLAPLFSEKFRNNGDALKGESLHWSRSLYRLRFLQDVVPNSLLLGFLLILYLGYQVMVVRAITYGSFVAVYNGVQVMVSTINGILGSSILQYALNGSFLSDFFTFLHTHPQVTSGEVPVRKPEEAVDAPEVSELRFSYPRSEKFAIDGLSFAPKGYGSIAVVGYNSAGKSTLMKLLTRLYDASEGDIRFGGRRIQEYDLLEYRSLFAVMPQEIRIFAASLGENVAMDTEYDSERAWDALRQAGLSEILPEGKDSLKMQMTREFSADGLVFSGGQQQKLALARAYYRDAPVLILDEPSAALDPMAEYQLNQQVARLAKEKTILYVSHRLTTVKMAEYVLMMENGQIVEQGSHQALLALQEKYAEMWHAQAQKYRISHRQKA